MLLGVKFHPDIIWWVSCTCNFCLLEKPNSNVTVNAVTDDSQFHWCVWKKLKLRRREHCREEKLWNTLSVSNIFPMVFNPLFWGTNLCNPTNLILCTYLLLSFLLDTPMISYSLQFHILGSTLFLEHSNLWLSKTGTKLTESSCTSCTKEYKFSLIASHTHKLLHLISVLFYTSSSRYVNFTSFPSVPSTDYY